MSQIETISTIIFLLENSSQTIQTQHKNIMPTLSGPLMGTNFRPKNYQAFFGLAWPANCQCHEEFSYGSWMEQ
ncbi:hypothetical protein BDA96_03G337500 [Sorghum bicolor]|uniref:Uncharacterized protein n=2 Tax=Sorghum bicolor TaxID=4558 RepID=A0A921RG31_SORBI|nr:hypothetical protein BDA96_03G337500 [Sorghum bicolor]KXG33482.1 hypothetical protein SORBI_3003G312800 [Sorghum bicolor]